MGLPLSAGIRGLDCLAILLTAGVAQAEADEPAMSPAAKQPSFPIVSDTQVSYWHEFTGAEPASPFR